MITGRIIEANSNGLRVSLEFFDDVIIPSTMMQEPSLFIPSEKSSQKEGTWVWKYGDDTEASPEESAKTEEPEHRFVMEKGDEVRTSSQYAVRIYFTSLLWS